MARTEAAILRRNPGGSRCQPPGRLPGRLQVLLLLLLCDPSQILHSRSVLDDRPDSDGSLSGAGRSAGGTALKRGRASDETLANEPTSSAADSGQEGRSIKFPSGLCCCRTASSCPQPCHACQYVAAAAAAAARPPPPARAGVVCLSWWAELLALAFRLR